MPTKKSNLAAYQNISPGSGFPIVMHPHFNPNIKDHVPDELLRKEITPPKDRAFFADPEKIALFSVAKPVDLTESIGTVLEGAQLSQLDEKQLDELAALANERGVVFFRDQDLTTEQQVKLFEHYGILDRHPAQKARFHVTIKGSTLDHRSEAAYTPWPNGDFHADTSFEINPPLYSMLRMEEHPTIGADTAWVSQYGLCDALTDAMKRFVDGLHTAHTSRLQYDTILDSWQVGPNRPPIDTHHPAVRTHPVTGLKALNVNNGFVTSFPGLKKEESDKLLQFFRFHIHSADNHYVRWKCTVHRVIPGNYDAPRRGVTTTVVGEKPYFDQKKKAALNGNTNSTTGVKTGVEAKTGDASNGPANGNGVEVKPEVASPNRDGFRYNEYDGKA
ncbi:TauD-domain-containing protein [Hyaloscypha bicolor E]|uniref:TauD-domain-containing protein n=1 Tax=Hyaloscypha bicolor E TaxID=1095630 RepID=A0A2J6TKF9_9HELO|nr:TauD-domain-containing protein [Hyaloscypha bicolor E]PMD63500.1 TauD-domain-containing protein [Hyaloscypha bicolor E]